jgi:hypothetical protein
VPLTAQAMALGLERSLPAGTAGTLAPVTAVATVNCEAISKPLFPPTWALRLTPP